MSRPDEHPTEVIPASEDGDVGVPEVRSAPASPPRWHTRIPARLGRARTSTVVLSALFVAVFALFLSVRPDPAVQRASTVPAGGAVVTTTTPRAPRTTTPELTTPSSTAPTSTPSRTTEPSTSAPDSTAPSSDSGSSTATPSARSTTTTAPRTTSAAPTSAATTAGSTPTG